jgi:hypothetical protein
MTPDEIAEAQRMAGVEVNEIGRSETSPKRPRSRMRR